MAEALD